AVPDRTYQNTSLLVARRGSPTERLNEEGEVEETADHPSVAEHRDNPIRATRSAYTDPEAIAFHQGIERNRRPHVPLREGRGLRLLENHPIQCLGNPLQNGRFGECDDYHHCQTADDCPEFGAEMAPPQRAVTTFQKPDGPFDERDQEEESETEIRRRRGGQPGEQDQ